MAGLTYGDKTHACVVAVGDHFALFFAVDEVVVVLHAEETVLEGRVFDEIRDSLGDLT